MKKKQQGFTVKAEHLDSLAEQFTGYAMATGWEDCPGFSIGYNYLTRLYSVKVNGTRMSRAFTGRALFEIITGSRDPSYMIKDLQEQWSTA